ncbi:hypothetical protein E0Z10_g2759 [Xylaria hypoxylon]|uniref:DUF7730 domain-containing protein n=1 Tax=Xylaria hypoxylon TaxID=37992 RepID=A0A4Z0Z982_9PEZI|nr:hypothetical protein E0Z10_g2759 [Xylaria hypoxylon]
MAELPGKDTFCQIGLTGETPCFGRGARTGISTPSADSGPQPQLADQSRTKASSHFSVQNMNVTIIEDDGISPLPTAPQSHSQPPALLNLPLEIRLEIYAHLLTTPSYPLPYLPTSPSPSSAPFFVQQIRPSPLYPSILRTCRQLHAECIPVLYSSNTFLAHTSLLTAFPSFFSPGHPRKTYAPIRNAALASLVTRFRVRLRLDTEPQFERDQVTAQFSGKSEVVIEAWQAEWRGVGPDVLRLFEGVRGVRTARVTGSTGGFEEYAHWLERAMMAGIGNYVKPFSWEDGHVKGSIQH